MYVDIATTGHIYSCFFAYLIYMYVMGAHCLLVQDVHIGKTILYFSFNACGT